MTNEEIKEIIEKHQHLKSETDAVIAELKREIKRLKEENEMTLVGVNLHSPTSDGRFV